LAYHQKILKQTSKSTLGSKKLLYYYIVLLSSSIGYFYEIQIILFMKVLTQFAQEFPFSTDGGAHRCPISVSSTIP